ncbi:MAG: hypothetical protein M5R36_13695 [Deltaproteobacteria bacterium]|nr:hypothetical protein [Deltaproteobacteria bacterium]
MTHENGTWVAEALDAGTAGSIWWGMDNIDSQYLLTNNYDFHYEYGHRVSDTDNWAYESIIPEYQSTLSDFTDFIVDEFGHAHFVRPYNRDLLYATDSSGAWQTELLPALSGGVLLFPSIDVGQSDSAAVAVVEVDSGVLVSTFADGEWESFDLVDGLGTNRVALKFDAVGTVHLAYGREDGIAYATQSGDSWNVELVDSADNDASYAYDPIVLCLSSGDEPRIAYSAGQKTYFAWKYLGNSWVIDEIEFDAAYLSLAVDDEDMPHLFLSLYDQAGVYYVTGQPGTWQTSKIDNAAFMISSASTLGEVIRSAYLGTDNEANLVRVRIN